MVGSHNERGLPSKNYNGGNNGREITRGQRRRMLLDWIMKVDYSKLKERAGHRGEWHHWTNEPTYEGK